MAFVLVCYSCGWTGPKDTACAIPNGCPDCRNEFVVSVSGPDDEINALIFERSNGQGKYESPGQTIARVL